MLGSLANYHTHTQINKQVSKWIDHCAPTARANMAGLVLCKLAGDRVIAPAHNGLNAYLLSCNIVKYLCPLAIGGKGLLADKTAYLTDNITEKSRGEHPKPSIALYINFLKAIKKPFQNWIWKVQEPRRFFKARSGVPGVLSCQWCLGGPVGLNKMATKGNLIFFEGPLVNVFF